MFPYLFRTSSEFQEIKSFWRSTLAETTRWVSRLGCEPPCLPFTYLGVPVGANMKLKKNWKPIIDKFMSKLTVWKSKTLLFRGRLTQITTGLDNLPTYYLSIFIPPA